MRSVWRAVSALAVFGYAASAYAANDGQLGTSSTGDLNITVTIQELVRISGLRDIAFGSYSGSGDLAANEDICVYRNNTGGQYKVAATAAEGAFQLKNGANALPYAVYFNQSTGTTGEVQLAYGTASVTQSGANTVSGDCSTGGLSANVHVALREADLQAAKSGAYSGTLILTVNPV